ncbi:MAG: glycosyltransferase family 4 protein, partial [Lachnospiraceae bacterium]|nr:glycosyltransferase family 4 protein [Lachnospiraceae bacterium]
PVVLVVTLLHSSIDLVPIEDLKSKYGFSSKDKLILYVGRFVEEKRPLRAIEVFSKVHGKDEAYKLIMIGQGPMHSAIDECIRGHALEGYVTIVSHIPNKDMWEFYSMSDCFINLNQQEIFGMAILEAMYYGCKTVAWTAPGPDYIIDDGIDGYIVRSDDEVIDRILYKGDVSYASRNKILECFTWKATASNIVEVLK